MGLCLFRFCLQPCKLSGCSLWRTAAIHHRPSSGGTCDAHLWSLYPAGIFQSASALPFFHVLCHPGFRLGRNSGPYYKLRKRSVIVCLFLCLGPGCGHQCLRSWAEQSRPVKEIYALTKGKRGKAEYRPSVHRRARVDNVPGKISETGLFQYRSFKLGRFGGMLPIYSQLRLSIRRWSIRSLE